MTEPLRGEEVLSIAAAIINKAQREAARKGLLT
jgi:hypothetical protein